MISHERVTVNPYASSILFIAWNSRDSTIKKHSMPKQNSRITKGLANASPLIANGAKHFDEDLCAKLGLIMLIMNIKSINTTAATTCIPWNTYTGFR